MAKKETKKKAKVTPRLRSGQAKLRSGVSENKSAPSAVAKSATSESVKSVDKQSVTTKLKKSEKQGRSKSYRKVVPLVEKGKEYELLAALDLVKKTSISKFDAAVEVHFRLGVDLAKSEQQVRASVVLPHGTGKTLRVAVVCSAGKEKEAKSAGAEEVGGESLIKKMESGKVNFDILVATPDMMGALGRVAKFLGPKGLMPNPKSGTVTMDIEKTIKDIKSGKIEFRNDPSGIIHQAIGRVSFDAKKLEENFSTLLEAVHRAKPGGGVKGTYILSAYLCSTMGPSVKLDLSKLK